MRTEDLLRRFAVRRARERRLRLQAPPEGTPARRRFDAWMAEVERKRRIFAAQAPTMATFEANLRAFRAELARRRAETEREDDGEAP